MKFKTEYRRASVLTIILVSVVLIGLTLGSYLNLVSNQNQSILRSQMWNTGIPLAEAGIEEAMTHLNSNLSNRAGDGWRLEGTNLVKERKIGDNKFRVMISNGEPPSITSEGHVWMTRESRYLETPRVLRVTSTNDALFARAMVANREIDLAGNSIMTDSFDSEDPRAVNGQDNIALRGDKGDIATNGALVDSRNDWDADIYGRVATGPGGTAVFAAAPGANASIGELSWHTGGRRGAEPGWTRDDMNVQFPDVKVPFSGGGLTLTADVEVGGTNYTYVIGSGNFQVDEISLRGGESVAVIGNAVLHVRGNVSVADSAFIYIIPRGSLHIYVEGDSARIAGNGIVNENSTAGSFGYWGLNSNRSVEFARDAQFIGTIYAPHAELVLGGGGGGRRRPLFDFVGACVAGTIRLNGNFNFHYDEALGRSGPRRAYTITSWNEAAYVRPEAAY